MFDFILNAESNIAVLIAGLVVGMVLIIFGGDKFVDSAIWVAVKTKIPQMIIGATIVSIGTTLPELFTSYLAAGAGETSIAVGNVFGSLVSNTALVLGISLAVNPSNIDRKGFTPKYIILIVSVLFLIFFALDSEISIWQSIVLVVLFVGYFAYSIIDAVKKMKAPAKTDLGLKERGVEKDGTIYESEFIAESSQKDTQAEDAEFVKYNSKKSWVMILFFILGAAAIAIGADFLVNSVSGICEKVGVPKDVIALTIVGLGTSLPELVTTITSLKKNSTEIAVGNIIGANIINTTLIVGGSGLIAGGLMIENLTTIMVSVVLLFVVLLVVGVPILVKKRTYRYQGITCLALYGVYLGFLVFQLVAAK